MCRTAGASQAQRGERRGGGGAGHHEQRVHDVVRGDHARTLGRRRRVLDDRVERHGEDAAARRQQEQVDDHPPAGERGQRGGGGRDRARPDAADEAKSQQNSEMPSAANGTSRARHLAVEQARALHGADADADGEHRQQQREHSAVGMQRVARDHGELGHQRGAHGPEPGQAEHARARSGGSRRHGAPRARSRRTGSA